MKIIRLKQFSKKEDAAKTAAVAGSVAGLGGAATSLGAKVAEQKTQKDIADALKKITGNETGIKGKKALLDKASELSKKKGLLEKIGKKAGKIGKVGLGVSVEGGATYKALKKNDKK